VEMRLPESLQTGMVSYQVSVTMWGGILENIWLN